MTDQTHDYFDLAQGWADERDVAAARARRIAWTVAILAGSVAVLEAVALAYALPLKTMVPMAVLVDRTTGRVEQVDLSRPQTLGANEALQQSLLAQYVVARESYDPVGIRTAFRKVALWSTGQARSSYVDAASRDPAAARLSPIRREIGLATTIRSVSLLGPQSAQVRFDVSRVDITGRLADVRPYVATIAYAFSGQPMKIEDRFDNPLGFEVRSYRVDAEAPPPVVDQAAGPDAVAASPIAGTGR